MPATLDDAEVDVLYDELAQAIDGVSVEDEQVFLTSLCLLLSHRLGDIAVVRTSIAEALAAMLDAARGAGSSERVRSPDRNPHR